jgi:hypothetical protein
MPTAPTPITALPPAPNPDDDESTFDAAAYAYSAAQPACVTQTNALGANVFANAVEAVAAAAAASISAGTAASQASTATTQAGIATTKAGEAAASASTASTAAGNASASASAAAASAASAAALAGAFVGTSTSSVSIGAGTKNFTTQAGELYTPGVFMTAISAANNANWVFGQVLSYVGTALSLNVTMTGGSGTFADWNLSLAGPQGATGPQGPQGPTGGVSGGAMTGHLSELKAANITAAATTNVWAAVGNSATLVGTTAVTSFGTAAQAGDKFTLIAGAATPLTHSANVQLPGGVNYTTAVGDRIEIYAETATQMRVSIFKADGTAPVAIGTTYTARSSNTSLSNADKGKFIDITSGTFTQTFDAVASIGGSWHVWIRNSSSGDITLDPSGAELIDGLTSYIMYPGEARLVMCDGAALKSAVIRPFYKVFSSSGNFVKPPGYQLFEGLAWGAGGGGGSNGAGGRGGGGGGGQCWPFALAAASLSVSEAVTIGAGGPGGSSATGTAGGSTTLGALVTAVGGSPGQGGTSGDGGGGQGGSRTTVSNMFSTATSGTLTTDYGGAAGGAGGASGAVGNSSVYGGAGGGGATDSGTPNQGGTSTYGGNGGQGTNAGGTNGTAPAGAGGGGKNTSAGGNGARGELRIWGKV